MSTPPAGFHAATRHELSPLPLQVAPALLGALLQVTAPTGPDETEAAQVTVRITEVEAYHGQGTGERPDPASHARSGPTARNATMWGQPGLLYVYLSHGIHSCVNVVCGPPGVAGAVLLRAGEVVSGSQAAHRRRPAVARGRDLARGPGRLGSAVGLRHPVHDGLDAVDATPLAGAVAALLIRDEPVAGVRSGPRVGVAGLAGTDAFPWRFWIDREPTVSAFRWGRGARHRSDVTAS